MLVPLHVVVVRSERWRAASASAGFEGELPRVLEDVNGVFAPAHIRFDLASVETAVLDVARTDARPTVARVFEALPPRDAPRDGLRVYYAGSLDVNGVAVGTRAAIVQERAEVRRVRGGMEDTVARVTAHMLAGLLGLPAVADPVNLMGLGTSGAELDAGQAEALRDGAGRLLALRSAAP